MKVMVLCKKGNRFTLAALALCFCLAVFCIWEGEQSGRTAAVFFQNGMIRAEGEAFDAAWVVKAQKEIESSEGEEERFSFAAWTNLEKETVFAESGGRSSVTEVLAVCGPSYCLLPMGKNLLPDDTGGCIIGVKLAEDLFGTHRAEGQQLQWRGRRLTVRGIQEEPSDFLMVQAQDMVSFERISIALADSAEQKLAAEHFVNRYGLSAQVLRYDHRYGFSWLAEMVPAVWSDFAGWKQNMQEHQKMVELVKNTEKSTIEAAGIEAYNRRTIFFTAGIFFCILFFVVFARAKRLAIY